MKIPQLLGRGIQMKLVTAFLVLGVLPMAIMGAVSYYNSSAVVLDQTNLQMNNLGKKAAEQIDTILKVVGMQADHLLFPLNTVIGFIDVGMEIDPGSKENLVRDLKNFQKKYPEVLRVRLFDAKGNEKFDTSKGAGESGKNGSLGDLLNAAKGSKETTFGKMYFSKDFNGATLPVAKTTFNNDGKPIAVLVVDVSGKYVADSVVQIKYGASGYSYVLNQEGLTIAHPEAAKVFQLDVGSLPFGKEMLEKKTGMIEYSWEGKDQIACFQEIPKLKWIVATTVMKDDLLSSANRIRNISIVLGLIFLGAALAVALVLSSRIVQPIRRAVEGMTESAEKVALASAQVSSASQSLAEGSSEQAAGLEETSSSIEELTSMTRQNADNSNQANTQMAETSLVVENANHSMTDLTESMKEISLASEETAKIIKTIDEIAFQTNLLALNAAVEAARAGEAGAGFAVVADEVRNLSMRAAEAAKSTAELIESTVKKIKNGSDVVTRTNEAFGRVTVGAKKVAGLVGEISAASQEQAQGIEQINKALAEMDKVVQQNAANAEESASASEELNAQAKNMKTLVVELVAMVRGSNEEKRAASAEVLLSADPQSGKNTKVAIGHKRKAEGQKAVTAPGGKSPENKPNIPSPKQMKPDQIIPMGETDFKSF